MQLFDITLLTNLASMLLMWLVIFFTPKTALSKAMRRWRIVALITAPVLVLVPVFMVIFLLMTLAL